MRLTKYQKSRLLEFEWEVVGNGDDNTCWLKIEQKDGPVFDVVKTLLNLTSEDIDSVKVLIVASRKN